MPTWSSLQRQVNSVLSDGKTSGVTESALAFEPQAWPSIIFTCDPDQYRWGGPQSKIAAVREKARRFAGIFDALKPAVKKVAADAAVVRCNDAVMQMERLTRAFLETHRVYTRETIEQLLDEPEFRAQFAAFVDASAEVGPRSGRNRVNMLLPRVTAELANVRTQVDELATQLAEAPAKQSFTVATTPEKRKRELFWFAYDPLFPAEIADAIVGKIESETAFLLLKNATDWSTDDLLALAKQRLDGLRRYARFIAGIPGNHVALVPPNERLDVSAIIEKVRVGHEHVLAEHARIASELAK